jgi:L-arabinokinase
MKSIAYYITAHGYGHGTRSCDVLNALRRVAPDVPIIVKTNLPVDFMASRLPDSIEIRSGAFDLGLIQKDSIQVDLEASLIAIEKLYEHEAELIEQEMRFQTLENIGVVVADIPAIPLDAAQRAGIPNIACSNFGWNWIYSEFVEKEPRWRFFVDKFKAVYEKTDLLLRQPFCEPMSAFPNQIDLPLLAKPGINQREEIAVATGADSTKTWVLLSFTTLNLDFQALENLKRLRDRYELFTVEPLAWPGSGIHSLSRTMFPFANILASSDLVVTKPGFGIVSECIANHKPIIYSDRKNFLEYPVLVKSIERYCRYAFIPNNELYSGELERALSDAQSSEEPQAEMPRGGAEKAAEQILKRITT